MANVQEKEKTKKMFTFPVLSVLCHRRCLLSVLKLAMLLVKDFHCQVCSFFLEAQRSSPFLRACHDFQVEPLTMFGLGRTFFFLFPLFFSYSLVISRGRRLQQATSCHEISYVYGLQKLSSDRDTLIYTRHKGLT